LVFAFEHIPLPFIGIYSLEEEPSYHGKW